MGAPWIRDADGDLLTKLKMYPLKVVSPLLYLFRVRDKEITEAIEVCYFSILLIFAFSVTFIIFFKGSSEESERCILSISRAYLDQIMKE